MTIVAAYYDGDTYSISSDSTGVSGQLIVDRHQAKLINKKEYVVGYTYSFRVADLIAESTDFPEQIVNINDVREFRDILQNVLKEAGAIDKASKSCEMLQHPVGLIVVSPHGMWDIEADYQIVQRKHYCACGSGYEFAYGALYMAHKLQLEAKTATELAVKSAIEHCTTCGGRCYTKTFQGD